MPKILLVDNGSKRVDATLTLRTLALKLQGRIKRQIEPVSLLHSDTIPPTEFHDRPAQTLAPYLRSQLEAGHRAFLILPMFFGLSRALSRFVPDTVAALSEEFGSFELDMAQPLCPLPQGEPRLVEILSDNLAHCRAQALHPPEHVFLVDHGSPLPQVTAVRNWLAQGLSQRIGSWAGLTEAAMERRAGPDYDFNGPLLAQALETYASAHPNASVLIAMQFLAAGRHAGGDGDIVHICRDMQQRHPGFCIRLSPLMNAHPLLVDILEDRLRDCLSACLSK